MTNEELLQQILNSTIERLGKQTIQYEAEIANLSSQVLILKTQIKEIEESSKEKPAKVSPLKDQ
jgi:uncharacterized coiled-coil protein SlyX